MNLIRFLNPASSMSKWIKIRRPSADADDNGLKEGVYRMRIEPFLVTQYKMMLKKKQNTSGVVDTATFNATIKKLLKLYVNKRNGGAGNDVFGTSTHYISDNDKYFWDLLTSYNVSFLEVDEHLVESLAAMSDEDRLAKEKVIDNFQILLTGASGDNLDKTKPAHIQLPDDLRRLEGDIKGEDSGNTS